METSLSLPPVKSSYPAVNHLTMFGAFEEAFRLHLDSMQWPIPDRPVLVKDYPKARIGEFDNTFDVILFHTVRSEIASTSNDGQRKPKGYWGYKTEKHPTKAGYVLASCMWQELVTVQFKVLAKSNARADELVDWFHRMILFYAHGMKFFQARGINHLVFRERLEDTMTEDYGQELYVRPLRYDLRLELLDVAEAKLLESVSIALNGEQVQ